MFFNDLEKLGEIEKTVCDVMRQLRQNSALSASELCVMYGLCSNCCINIYIMLSDMASNGEQTHSHNTLNSQSHDT